MQLLLRGAEHLKEGINFWTSRWMFYAGADSRDRVFALDNPELERQRIRWAIYQANDLLHFAYEAFLKLCLDTLEEFPAGVPMNRLIAEMVSTISEAAPTRPTTWKDVLDSSPPAENANGSSPLAERWLVEQIEQTASRDRKTTAVAAWAALTLLAVLSRRMEVLRAEVQAERGSLNEDGFHSLATELTYLDQNKDLPFETMLANLIEARVIKRHLWVAHRKFRHQSDYTFLFEVDDGRVRPRAHSGPVFTNPRLAPAITFLRDLHLIDKHGASERGQVLLELP